MQSTNKDVNRDEIKINGILRLDPNLSFYFEHCSHFD